jgi:hypothetical protein
MSFLQDVDVGLTFVATIHKFKIHEIIHHSNFNVNIVDVYYQRFWNDQISRDIQHTCYLVLSSKESSSVLNFLCQWAKGKWFKRKKKITTAKPNLTSCWHPKVKLIGRGLVAHHWVWNPGPLWWSQAPEMDYTSDPKPLGSDLWLRI